jgi:PAS domain S-box-containing protein
MANPQEDNFKFVPMETEKKLFSLTNRPTPSERELEWDKSKVLLSKTDSRGNILYANESFIDVCGYDDFELMDKSHNLLRHPDMPKVIFKLLWENLSKGKDYNVVIKNMSKTGRYYWVVNDITTVVDDNENMFFTGKQKTISNDIINNHIEPLYKKLLHIEQASGIQSSENYLLGFLEERNKNYIQFINDLVSTGKDSVGGDQSLSSGGLQQKKKGFFSGFFADEAPKKKK